MDPFVTSLVVFDFAGSILQIYLAAKKRRVFVFSTTTETKMIY